MRCQNCAAISYDGAKFCIYCGAPLPRRSKLAEFFISCFKALAYLSLFFGVQLLFAFVYAIAVNFTLISTTEDYMTAYMSKYAEHIHTVTIAAALVTLAVLAVFFAARRKNIFSEACIYRLSPLNIPLTILLGVALQIFCSFTLALLPLPESWFEIHNEQNTSLLQGSFFMQFLDVAIITAVIEETIFRGLIYTRLKRGMPDLMALLLSAAIFGAAHGNILSFIYTSVLGILLALLLERTESLLAPMLCHFAFNGASLVLSLIDINSEALFFGMYIASAAVIACVLVLVFGVIGRKKQYAEPIDSTVSRNL